MATIDAEQNMFDELGTLAISDNKSLNTTIPRLSSSLGMSLTFPP